MRKRPLAAFDLLLLGHADLEQVPNRGGDDVLVALEVVVVARESAQRARDVGGDGGLFGDDEGLGQGAWSRQREPILTGAGRRRQGKEYLRHPNARTCAMRARTHARAAAVQALYSGCHSPPGSAATCPANSSPVSAATTTSGAIDVRATIGGIAAQRSEYLAFAVGNRTCGARRAACSVAAHAQFLEYVLCRFDQLGALANQLVAAFGQGGMYRAGNRKDLPTLLTGITRGDERSRGQRGLHDQHAEASARRRGFRGHCSRA